MPPKAHHAAFPRGCVLDFPWDLCVDGAGTQNPTGRHGQGEPRSAQSKDR
jgi:hypothetical protein